MDPCVLSLRRPPPDGGAETRRCSRCARLLPVSSFAKRSTVKGNLQGRCRDCMATYHAQWYARNRRRVIVRVHDRTSRLIRENRQRILAYLRIHSCVDCGEADPVVLEFDHLRDKRADVSELVRAGAGWRTILEEIDKCELRCVNCHKRVTLARAQAERLRALGCLEEGSQGIYRYSDPERTRTSEPRRS